MPRPDEGLGLGGDADRREAGRVGGPLHGGDIDVGRQVLPPDVAVRVVVDLVAEVRTERAVAAADRVVQLGRREAVVDEQEHAAGESRRRRRRSRPRARGRSRPSGRRRGRRRSVARRSARATVDGSISISTSVPSGPMSTASSRSAIAALANPMDRQRIEDLVRQDDAVEWAPPSASSRCAAEAGGGQPGREGSRCAAGPPPLAGSARSAREPRFGRDRGRRVSATASAPCPGAVLADDEPLRLAEAAARSRRSPSARVSPKIGCSSGAVRKSPPRPGRGVGRPVVAAVGVVERELHEPGERHRAVAPDLVADALEQLRRLRRRR